MEYTRIKARWNLLKKESLFDCMKYQYLKSTPLNKRTREQSRFVEDKSEEMSKRLNEVARRTVSIKNASFAIWGGTFLILSFLFFQTIIISDRKVTGAGHNFVRRAIMELNESPAMQNIEATVDIHDLPIVSKGVTYLTGGKFGMRSGWVFDEKKQRAHLDLGIILKSKLNNAEYIGK